MAPPEIVGWIAVAFSMAISPFQIYENCHRGSTEGVNLAAYILLFSSMGMFAGVAWVTGVSIPIRVQFIFAALSAAIVLFQMWWYHPHRHVFHKYLMRNHHKESMPKGEQEDVVTHSSHHR